MIQFDQSTASTLLSTSTISVQNPSKHLGQVPLANQSQDAANNIKTTQHGGPKKRLLTPHPRKNPAGLHYPSREAPSKATSSAPKFPNGAPLHRSAPPSPQKIPPKARTHAPSQLSPSLAARLALLSRPKRNAAIEKEPAGGSTLGRPLWSGNFSGANSPARNQIPCKAKPGMGLAPQKRINGSIPGGSDTIRSVPLISDGSTNCSTLIKGSIPLESTANKSKLPASTIASSGTGAGIAAAVTAAPPLTGVMGCSTSGNDRSNGNGVYSSPIVQYVSYNYRPVVVQSPSTNLVSLPRFQSTSTLEILPS